MSFGAPDFPQPPIKRKEHQTIKCIKCGGECKTLSAMISDDSKKYICSLECKDCGHTETVQTVRIGAPREIDAIV